MGDNRKPVPLRSGGVAPRFKPLAGIASFIGVITLLELGARAGFIPALIFPAPSAIGAALLDLIQSGQLAKHLGASLHRLIIGWALGVSLGILAGLGIGIWSLPRSLGLPWVAAISAIPKIALLPLFIIWFGIGEGAKIATIAFGTFFPTVINTYAGVDDVPRTLIRMGQSFNLNTSTLVRTVILPATLPAILAACRIAASIAIILLVSAEMVSAQFGIGAYIIQQQNLFQLDRLMAGVTVLMILGLAVHGIISLIERRLLSWR